MPESPTPPPPPSQNSPVVVSCPGWKTSEFWLAVLGAIIGLVLCFHSKESMNEFGVMLICTSVGTYSLGRGISKITVPTSR